jgi:serine/threonine protein kinase
VKDLIDKLLEKNNHFRPSAIELLKTDFFKKYVAKVIKDVYDIDP